MFVYCHVVIFAETMERDLVKEQLLGDIILGGGDPLSFLNDTDGQEGDDDGSGDRMAEEEGDHDDGSGDRTEEAAVAKSGEVYILIKPVLTN
jgi:hypothetical protein